MYEIPLLEAHQFSPWNTMFYYITATTHTPHCQSDFSSCFDHCDCLASGGQVLAHGLCCFRVSKVPKPHCQWARFYDSLSYYQPWPQRSSKEKPRAHMEQRGHVWWQMVEEGIERRRGVGILERGKVGDLPLNFLVMLVPLLPGRPLMALVNSESPGLPVEHRKQHLREFSGLCQHRRELWSEDCPLEELLSRNYQVLIFWPCSFISKALPKKDMASSPLLRHQLLEASS